MGSPVDDICAPSFPESYDISNRKLLVLKAALVVVRSSVTD